MNTFVFFLALLCSFVCGRDLLDDIMTSVHGVPKDWKYTVCVRVLTVLLWTWYHWLTH